VRALALAAVLVVLGACGSDGDTAVTVPAVPAPTAASFVGDVTEAIAAVEAELGGPQEFFEVTASARFTNVFVAVDEASAAVPYLYVDGELEAPGPVREGASGNTFVADDVEIDPAVMLSGVAAELPDTTIDALSVYGDGVGAVYVLAATSAAGGRLDIVVTADGAVVSVDPL
jgi:hypothetical protein